MTIIWCVDDDNTIREIEVYTLTQLGMVSRGFADGRSVLDALQTELPDLIVLDIMMPEIDGIAVLKAMRSNPRTASIPVIMATAKGTEIDTIQGLDAGADDYLVKPFGMMEMVSRIKAVLRRCQPKVATKVLTVGQITLDDKAHQVAVDGKAVSLTPKEFAVLELFLRNVGIVLSRDRLLSEVWGIDYLGESRTVDMHIKTLRQKLGIAGKQIKTVIGIGYRMEEKP